MYSMEAVGEVQNHTEHGPAITCMLYYAQLIQMLNYGAVYSMYALQVAFQFLGDNLREL